MNWLGRVLVNSGVRFQTLTGHALHGRPCLRSGPSRPSGNCGFRARGELPFAFIGEVFYLVIMIHYWLVLKRTDCRS